MSTAATIGRTQPPAPTNVSWLTFVLTNITQFFQGLLEGLSVHRAVGFVLHDDLIRQTAANCVFLNGFIFLGSMMAFDWVVRPVLRSTFGDFSTAPTFVLSLLYQLLWLYPVYIITFAFSTSWHAVIANQAVKISYGPLTNSSSATSGSSSSSSSSSPASAGMTVTDAIAKTLLYIVVVIQAFLVSFIPFIGSILSFILTSLVYAFLCADTKWLLVKNWSLKSRISKFEIRWAFFLGFGAPFTITSFFFPVLVGCGIYAILFPFYVLMLVDVDELASKYKSTNSLPIFSPLIRLLDITIAAIFRRLFSASSSAQQTNTTSEANATAESPDTIKKSN